MKVNTNTSSLSFFFFDFYLFSNIEPTSTLSGRFWLVRFSQTIEPEPDSEWRFRNTQEVQVRYVSEPEQVLNRTFLVNPGSIFSVHMHTLIILVVHTA